MNEIGVQVGVTRARVSVLLRRMSLSLLLVECGDTIIGVLVRVESQRRNSYLS